MAGVCWGFMSKNLSVWSSIKRWDGAKKIDNKRYSLAADEGCESKLMILWY